MDVRNLFSIKGRVALVTGGAGLYGSCISTAFGEAGAKVIIASRDLKKCGDKAKELQNKGFDASGEQMDQTSEESVIELKDKIVSKYGRIDILVNNAVERPMKGFDEPAANWERSMHVNSTGLYICTKIFVSEMVRQKSGNIINISSIYGMLGPDFDIYQGTKMDCPADYAFHRAGIINFTRYLATRFAKDNIRVNCISAGGLYNNQPEPFLGNYSRRAPLGRMANDDDIKGAVIYLASDAASYVTGHNLIVDGGWSAW